MTQASRKSKVDGIEDVAENPQEDQIEVEPVIAAKPEDFICCNLCSKDLSQDEKIINARFVNEAFNTGRDISLFPICMNCNFE
jgi:hypothetical protein